MKRSVNGLSSGPVTSSDDGVQGFFISHIINKTCVHISSTCCDTETVFVLRHAEVRYGSALLYLFYDAVFRVYVQKFHAAVIDVLLMSAEPRHMFAVLLI